MLPETSLSEIERALLHLKPASSLERDRFLVQAGIRLGEQRGRWRRTIATLGGLAIGLLIGIYLANRPQPSPFPSDRSEIAAAVPPSIDEPSSWWQLHRHLADDSWDAWPAKLDDRAGEGPASPSTTAGDLLNIKSYGENP